MTQESRLVIVIDSKNAERNTRAIADELANLTNKGVQADTQMTAMSSSIKSLVGYMGGLLTINKAIAMADGYTQMAARIRNATQSAEEYTLVQDRLLKTANTTYRQLGEAQEVYLSMAGGMKSLGKSTKDTLDLTDSLSFSFTHNATRIDQAQSAMDALSKSMAKGKVDGDAWISIVTGADNVIADMAKQTGKTEAQIRKLGAEGKVSLEDLIKTLIATREQNEKLANNMENSLADGFTKLSNEVTVYLGKANEASSATGIMASGLGALADNLDLVANTGAAIGLGYVTTALLTKGAVVKKSIVDSIARRAADQAEIQSQLQLAAVEVQRTRQIEALAIQEVHLARLELNSAITRTERAAATMRLTQAEVALGIASKQTTAATAANTVVQNANNASKRASILTSTSLIGLLGGPVGLGVTVATVAAGYMLMRDSTDKATVSIDFQGQKVDDLVVKYRELNTLQRDNETKALADQVNDLSLKFRVASSDLTSFMQALPVADEKINTWSKLHSQFSLGKISSDEYYKSILALNILNDDQLDKVRGLIGGYDSSNKGMKEAEVAQKALAAAAKKTTQEAKDQAVSVAELSEKIKELLKSSSQNITDSSITSALASRGYNDTMIDLAKKYLAVEGAIVENAQGQRVLRDDLKKMLKAEYDAIMKAKGAVDSRNEAEKERTKELEKQQKVLQVNALVAANAAKANATALESAKNLPKGLLSAVNMVESPHSNSAKSGAGASGPMQFMPDTADRYKVDIKSVESSYRGASNYLKDLLKMFDGDIENALRAYNWGEGNMQNYLKYGSGMKKRNGKWQKGYFADKPMPKETREYSGKVMGYMGGASGASFNEDYSFDDWMKEQEKLVMQREKFEKEQADKQKQLTLDVASYKERVNTELADKIKEIEEAGFSPERTKELKAEYQVRADNDIAIANYALKTKLDDYGAFKKTESRLLEDSFNERKFYAARDIELTKDQRDKAVKLLDEQLKQEQAMLILAKETRIFQAEQAMYSEMELIQKRYAFDVQEIAKVQDADERSRLLNAASFNKKESENDLTKSLTGDYMGVMGFEKNPLIQQFKIIQKARENDLINEEQYQNAKLQLQAKSTASYMEGMFSGFASMVDENSKTYAVLFAAQKAFAVAQAMLNIPAAYSKAYDAVVGTPYVGPYIAPVVGAAAAALQVAQAASIKSTTMSGFKTGGYTGNLGVNQEAGVVHGQEYVLNAAATRRVGVDTLNAINNGGAIQAEKQAQANAKVQSQAPQIIDNQLRVIMVKDEDEAKNWLYNADGEKAFLYHYKRNKSKL